MCIHHHHHHHHYGTTTKNTAPTHWVTVLLCDSNICLICNYGNLIALPCIALNGLAHTHTIIYSATVQSAHAVWSECVCLILDWSRRRCCQRGRSVVPTQEHYLPDHLCICVRARARSRLPRRVCMCVRLPRRVLSLTCHWVALERGHRCTLRTIVSTLTHTYITGGPMVIL